MDMLHYTVTMGDHRHAVTYCGLPFVTDHAATRQVQSSGQWIMCPLCELRMTLIQAGLEPDPMESAQPADETHGPAWTQPTLFT